MSEIHIVIQRWFSNGEGWAYDAGFPEDIRLEVVKLVSETAVTFSGETIQKHFALPNWQLYVLVEPDTHCLDPKAVSRHPHVDIGILIPLKGKETDISAAQKYARTVQKRGQFELPSTLQGPSSHGGLVVLCLLGLIALGVGTWFAVQKPSEQVAENETTVEVQQPQPEPVQEAPVQAVAETTPEILSEVIPEKELVSAKEVAQTAELPSENLPVEVVETPKPEATPEPPPVPEIEVKNAPENAFIASWEFSAFKTRGLQEFPLNAFVRKINEVQELISKSEPKSNPDYAFLAQQFPKEKLEPFPEKMTEEEYQQQTRKIMELMGVSNFNEIKDKLNCHTFFDGYDFRRLDRVSDKIRDVALEFWPDSPVESNPNLLRPLKISLEKIWKFTDEDLQKRPEMLVLIFCRYTRTPIDIQTAKQLVVPDSFFQYIKKKRPYLELEEKAGIHTMLEEYMKYCEVENRKNNIHQIRRNK